MKLNVPAAPVFTAEGGKASRITHEQELRRTIMACLLWEDGFYENGASVADRIKELIPHCRTAFLAACAVHARHAQKLRHVPLLLVREMARHPQHKIVVSKLLPDVIHRADELAEFLAIYWKDGKQPLSAQVKIGLAKAFEKFDEYSLAKYNRDGAVKLRDVAFLSHPSTAAVPRGVLFTPKTIDRKYPGGVVKKLVRYPGSVLDKLVNNQLETPNTWETRLSGGEDKKTVFMDLMQTGELGAIAFLRNLRNMVEAGVPLTDIRTYGDIVKVDWVLPYQFVTAARIVPQLEDMLEVMMFRCLDSKQKLPGSTLLMVDVSGSMDEKLSAKSETRRVDTACGLAILARELCESVSVVTFSNSAVLVPPRRGFALRDAILKSQAHIGTYFSGSLKATKVALRGEQFDRTIVITDEQSADGSTTPVGKGYIVNVATNKRGIGYGQWTKIDGWSEAVLKYIQLKEGADEVLQGNSDR